MNNQKGCVCVRGFYLPAPHLTTGTEILSFHLFARMWGGENSRKVDRDWEYYTEVCWQKVLKYAKSDVIFWSSADLCQVGAKYGMFWL